MIKDWSHQTLLSLQNSHNIGVILLSIHVIRINSFTQLSQISYYHTLRSFSTTDKMEFFTVIGSGLFNITLKCNPTLHKHMPSVDRTLKGTTEHNVHQSC